MAAVEDALCAETTTIFFVRGEDAPLSFCFMDPFVRLAALAFCFQKLNGSVVEGFPDCVRPYYVENTVSRPICEVKPRQAR